MNKPPFNPNQAFQPVASSDATAPQASTTQKPAFDWSKPFQPVNEPPQYSNMDKAELLGKVMSVMAGPDIVSSPKQLIQKGFDAAGEKATEQLGKRGHPVLG